MFCRAWIVLVLVAFARSLRAQAPVAPPPALPIVSAAASVLASGTEPNAASPQLYSIGSPTDEEQFYLELINRARANPAAEGVRLANTTDPDVRASYNYFGVDLGLMQSQLAALAPLPPLSMNATLLDAARAHTQNMLQNAYQGHTGPDGSVTTRLATYLLGANGYAYGENVYSYSKSVFYGHAGFEVDWGGTSLTGGMQLPPGHRENIHGDFREVGIGVVNGTNGSVGPQLVTQDFGLRYDTPAIITGVVYRDVNGNGFYDPGEGIGGITVTVAGASYYAVTAPSGGYSVPVPANGTYLVNFSGGGAPTSQQNASVTSGNNTKLDYVLPATAPTQTPTPTPSGATTLANISTRSFVGTGANVLIGGFIIAGTQPKKVIVRAIGPSLPLVDKLLDPTLELHDATGALIAANDNWADNANKQEIIASTIAPSDAHESAVLTTLAPGSYTAVVSSANQTTGSAVVEIYDLDGGTVSQLANISTRALVQTGDHAMIGGMILVGGTQAKVLVRALGPSLAIAGALADPTLELRDANGALIIANDDWRSTQAAEISATTIPPSNDKESAIVATLAPAAYTAIVRGVNNTSGVALVEIYRLN
jgi:hypothetical protein